MLNAGLIKNFECSRTVCLWAGAFGVIQSIIWIGLTLTGILSYNCIITIDETLNYGTLFKIVLMQLYFMGSCDDTIPAYNDYMLRSVETVLNPQNILIWNSVYLAVNVCWFLISLLLITYIKSSKTKIDGVLWTWVIITFCICGMDLALGVIFGIDYGRFNRMAHNYNLSDIYAGGIIPDAAQLLAGMVTAMSMMIVSLKGFILWITNVVFMIYLALFAICIGKDGIRTNNLFVLRKNTRPPINAYGEEESKPRVFANEAFEPDTRETENVDINEEVIARAARISTDVSLQEGRFRNLDNFQQYPPSSRPESFMPVQKQQPETSTAVEALPAPDYTPPMQRTTPNSNRN